MRRPSPVLVATCVLALGWAGSATAQSVQSTLVASGVTNAVHAAAPPGDSRVFVLDRGGRIRIVQSNGNVLTTPFLDIAARVGTGGEGGLLGLAFPEDYASSGLFTVYYTNLN